MKTWAGTWERGQPKAQTLTKTTEFPEKHTQQCTFHVAGAYIGCQFRRMKLWSPTQSRVK